MRRPLNQLILAAASAALASALLGGSAMAGNYNDMGAYNHPYGMSPGQETNPVTPSMRDANGNLTMVNGQITSATMSQQSGVQQAHAGTSGSGNSGSGVMYGGASAIGNSLNVVTTGSFNTVIVNSKQTNNGNQTADVNINAH